MGRSSSDEPPLLTMRGVRLSSVVVSSTDALGSAALSSCVVDCVGSAVVVCEGSGGSLDPDGALGAERLVLGGGSSAPLSSSGVVDRSSSPSSSTSSTSGALGSSSSRAKIHSNSRSTTAVGRMAISSRHRRIAGKWFLRVAQHRRPQKLQPRLDRSHRSNARSTLSMAQTRPCSR